MKISKIVITVGAFLLLAVVISACSTQVQYEEATVAKTVHVAAAMLSLVAVTGEVTAIASAATSDSTSSSSGNDSNSSSCRSSRSKNSYSYNSCNVGSYNTTTTLVATFAGPAEALTTTVATVKTGEVVAATAVETATAA